MFLIPIRDSAPRYRLPILTTTLMLANIAVYAYFAQNLIAGEEYEWLFERYGVSPVKLFDAWRAPLEDMGNLLSAGVLPLLTYQFLHGSPLHLLGNLIFLWVFGDNIEGRLGSWRFLVFYLSCGVLAAMTHCMMLPSDTAPVIGASGAIAGVLGAYLFLFPKARVTLLAWVIVFVTLVELPAWVLLLCYFVLQIPAVQGFLNFAESAQGIAWWAHVGGFIAGAALLPLFCWRNPVPSSRQD